MILFQPKFDKHDHFLFWNCLFPILDGDVPRATSYGVYIFQLIGLEYFLNTAISIINFAKLFSKLYSCYYDFISKFHVGLKSLLR